MRFDADGTLLSDRVLNAAGALEYHPGGLDYDGRSVWVTLAQYRPNSTSTFLRVDPLRWPRRRCCARTTTSAVWSTTRCATDS